MPKLKANELAKYQGLAVARNVGPSRQQKNSGKMDAARLDKAVLGKDEGELGKPWDERFRKGGK